MIYIEIQGPHREDGKFLSLTANYKDGGEGKDQKRAYGELFKVNGE